MKFMYRRAMALVSKFHTAQGRKPIANEIDSVANYGEAWLSSEIPEKQWAVAKPQLERLQNGELTPEFAVPLYFAKYSNFRFFSSSVIIEFVLVVKNRIPTCFAIFLSNVSE